MKKFKRFAAAFLAVIMIVGILPVSAHADSSKLIALTFDDGPSSQNTVRLLDGLKARGAHCTFFLVGKMAEYNPSLVKRAWQEGHEIASHTYSHPTMTSKTDAEIKQELQKTDAILDKAIGQDFDYMLRPPYGDYNSRVLKAANTPCFFWSMDTYDWKSNNADSVYNEFIKQAKDGSIALLHDTHSTSVTAALRAIDTLQAQGYEFVTLSELFMRRGISLENGKIYFNAYPGKNGTAAAVGEPVIKVEDTQRGKLVTISGGDKRGRVYYTLDGSLPTPTNSTKYTGPFYIEKSAVIRAQTVIKWNSIRSDDVSLTVKYNPTATPVISISDGSITMQSRTNGAQIYYTSDGSAPDKSSTLYTGSFEAKTGTVYKARAYAPSYDASAAAVLTYSDRGNLFTDVTPSDWFYDDVDAGVSDGLFKGTAQNTFSPNTNLTRAMLAMVLYRASGQPEVSGTMTFSDAPKADSWCYNALLWASSSGILKGYPDGTVRPGKDITRAELGCMIARYLENGGMDISGLNDALSGFSDASGVPASMRSEVNAVCALGIIKGFEDNSLRPNSGATRAQAAVMLERMLSLE